MKTTFLIPLRVALLLAALGACVSTGFGQGALTPPGGPAPGMRTLLQIEPRTPISSLPYTITLPGSYYATTNLTGVSGTNGITIVTSNVVIDLRGFTLTGVPGANDGIDVAATINNLLPNIIVKNGVISGWPGGGLDADNAINSQFSDLNISGNGSDGLDCGQQAIVRNCVAANNGLEGFGGVLDIFCTFEDCDAHDNGDAGFYTGSWSTFKNCHGNRNANTGFNPYQNCTFQDCVADDNYWGVYGYDRDNFVHCQFGYNAGPGMLGGDNCVVRDSVAANNGDNGIAVGNNCVIESCTASTDVSHGIVVSNFCTLDGCVASSNQLDNIVTALGCTVSRCTSDGSATGNGFTLGSGSTISDSAAFGNGVDGIEAGDRSTVRGCTATMNVNAGIHVNYQGTVQQCTSGNNGSYGILSDANGFANILNNNCSFNGILTFGGTPTKGAGIWVTNSPGCRIEGNTLDINYAALVVATGSGAFVLRNNAHGNVSTNYAIGGGNSWGPIVDASGGGDVSGIPNSSHPDANFIH